MWRYLMIEVGLIKKVKNKGLEFDLQAIDEEFLVMPEDGGKAKIRRLGIVITEVPENQYGIKKGTKMLMAE